MDTIDLLLKRRSVVAKNITEPGPSSEDLGKILQAGVRVPDHGKIGPWRIQVLDKDGQKALGDKFAAFYQADNPDAPERLVEVERQRPQRCPVLLIVTAHVQVPHKIPEMEQRLSGGALCQNILIASHALGYVAQWLTEWPAFDDRVKRVLGHDPETEIIGMIYIGSAAEAPSERSRPEIETVVSTWAG